MWQRSSIFILSIPSLHSINGLLFAGQCAYNFIASSVRSHRDLEIAIWLVPQSVDRSPRSLITVDGVTVKRIEIRDIEGDAHRKALHLRLNKATTPVRPEVWYWKKGCSWWLEALEVQKPTHQTHHTQGLEAKLADTSNDVKAMTSFTQPDSLIGQTTTSLNDGWLDTGLSADEPQQNARKTIEDYSQLPDFASQDQFEQSWAESALSEGPSQPSSPSANSAARPIYHCLYPRCDYHSPFIDELRDHQQSDHSASLWRQTISEYWVSLFTLPSLLCQTIIEEGSNLRHSAKCCSHKESCPSFSRSAFAVPTFLEYLN